MDQSETAGYEVWGENAARIIEISRDWHNIFYYFHTHGEIVRVCGRADNSSLETPGHSVGGGYGICYALQASGLGGQGVLDARAFDHGGASQDDRSLGVQFAKSLGDGLAVVTAGVRGCHGVQRQVASDAHHLPSKMRK